MSVAILFGSIIAVVFLVTFLSGRRFGPLALSLAAGAMLAEIWAGWLVVVVAGLGFEVPGLPHGVIATLIILLGPLLMLLLGGPRYFKKFERVASALCIALLTAALLVEPLGQYMTLDADALRVYSLLVEWQPYVITAGLGLGLIDLFLLHTAKTAKSDKS